ncbi:LPS assembly lipoprotein LptE [Pseudomonas piscis]|uniref:LPS-assembly lipoprotein LptE n=1 Tax=Pseudomonas piscis TaxID=2614538 RepID=UPI0021D6105E|nr:LPS assembly lipoprotein LptE [Pseudomonas piscis]MCU7651157.1 LPS assembly lipoprotein LptE [Pseudomonas piscis]
MIKRNLLVMGLALVLSACGFQLRGTGTQELSIKELDLSARDAYGATVKLLQQQLESSGVRVHAGAPYKLVLQRESNSQRTLSYTGGGNSAEYEISTKLEYEILTHDNLHLLNDKLEVQKVFVHDGNNITGSGQESAQTYQEMRRDLVQRMIIRLQLLSPEQLAQLQATAEAKAKADADALEAARKAEAETPRQSPMELPNQ